MKRLTAATTVVATMISGATALAATATFEDLALAPNSAEVGFGLTAYGTGSAFGEVENLNRFVSGGISFENRTLPAFASWSMWAYSNQTDNNTPGFGNDTSAWTGGGADTSGALVSGGAYGISFGAETFIDLPAGARRPVSIMITNTTYTALALRDGDAFSKKFGGDEGSDPDFFLLKILGENGAGAVTGSIDFYLADYRPGGSANDLIVNDWAPIDLAPLGTDVAQLRFELSSSDNGQFGMNTPAYFAVDNLVVVPEPSGMMLFFSGLGVMLGFRRFRHCSGAMVAAVVVVAAILSPWALTSNVQAEGISAEDQRIVGWAKDVSGISRGPVNIADHSQGLASFGDPLSALGPADVWALNQKNAPVVSLGDGGQITVAFDPPIANGPGEDFAVFENGFSEAFLELAFVEVSADGSTFKRFPATVLHQQSEQIGTYGALATSGLRNLAGIYPAGMGTPFDLEELGMEEVTHVRIIDAVGSIDPVFGSHDSEGNLINDPFPTPFASGGFDLDAIAVLNQKAITVEPVIVDSFENWVSEQFAEKDWQNFDRIGYLADPDGDGVTNFEEYALWTDPNTVNVSRTLEIRHLIEENTVEVRLPPMPFLRDGASYRIESSDGLTYWESEGGVSALAADPAAAEQGFFRLVVEPVAGEDAN